MNAPQIHLMMNHIPVVGVLFTGLALAAGLIARSGAILRLGLATLVLVALAAIPVFLSGEPAEEAVEKMAGVTRSTIGSHEDMAKRSMLGLQLLGAVSLVALARYGRRPVPMRFAAILLAAVVALSGGLAWTAHLGGQIRHPELVAASATGEAPERPAETEREHRD
jgi:hypothetical protein